MKRGRYQSCSSQSKISSLPSLLYRLRCFNSGACWLLPRLGLVMGALHAGQDGIKSLSNLHPYIMLYIYPRENTGLPSIPNGCMRLECQSQELPIIWRQPASEVNDTSSLALRTIHLFKCLCGGMKYSGISCVSSQCISKRYATITTRINTLQYLNHQSTNIPT